MSSSSSTFLAGLIAFVLITLICAPLGAWVFVHLWAWFIIPVFHLPALTVGPAMGVCLVTSYLTHQRIPQVKEDGEGPVERLVGSGAYAVSLSLVALVTGYVIHRCIS